MKRNVFGALTMIVLAAVVSVPLVAQQRAKADVPFAFEAGSKALPAGTYTVSSIADHGIVIRDNKGDAAMLICQSTEKLDRQSAKLVFHVYDNEYFLSEVWTGSSNRGMQIPEGKQEKELRLAKNGAASEVVVALR